MKKFEYRKPAETVEKRHLIELEVDGVRVGFARLEYKNNPRPFYYVHVVLVYKNYRGKGFGKDVLQRINDILDQKRASGILVTTIDEDSPAYKMYEKHGWVRIPNRSDWYGYNISGWTESQLAKAIYGISRKSF